MKQFLSLVLASHIRCKLKWLSFSQRNFFLCTCLWLKFVKVRHRLCVKTLLLWLLLLRISSNALNISGCKIEFLKDNLFLFSGILVLYFKEFILWHFFGLEMRSWLLINFFSWFSSMWFDSFICFENKRRSVGNLCLLFAWSNNWSLFKNLFVKFQCLKLGSIFLVDKIFSQSFLRNLSIGMRKLEFSESCLLFSFNLR